MKILVTGNKGYIGSVLCEELIKCGFDVTGLDSGFYKDCGFFDIGLNLKQITKDVRKIDAEDIKGVDAIIHLAALSNDPIGALSPKLTSDINFRASVRLAEMARENGVKRFIFSSSCSLYGVSGAGEIDESGKLNPLTEYAKSKVDAEKEITKLANDSFSPVFLRNATVYGISPMLRVDLVVNNLVGWAFTTGKIKIMSDGTPWRPLIHIQDICKAFISALRAPKELIHNEVFNVGSNNGNYQIREIAQEIKKVMSKCSVEYTGEHGSDSRTYKVNFNKISNRLKDYFTPSWSLDSGIREILDAYKNIGLTYQDFSGDKYTRLKSIKKIIDTEKVDNNLFWTKGARI